MEKLCSCSIEVTQIQLWVWIFSWCKLASLEQHQFTLAVDHAEHMWKGKTWQKCWLAHHPL